MFLTDKAWVRIGSSISSGHSEHAVYRIMIDIHPNTLPVLLQNQADLTIWILQDVSSSCLSFFWVFDTQWTSLYFSTPFSRIDWLSFSIREARVLLLLHFQLSSTDFWAWVWDWVGSHHIHLPLISHGYCYWVTISLRHSLSQGSTSSCKLRSHFHSQRDHQ